MFHITAPLIPVSLIASQCVCLLPFNRWTNFYDANRCLDCKLSEVGEGVTRDEEQLAEDRIIVRSALEKLCRALEEDESSVGLEKGSLYNSFLRGREEAIIDHCVRRCRYKARCPACNDPRIVSSGWHTTKQCRSYHPLHRCLFISVFNSPSYAGFNNYAFFLSRLNHLFKP